MKKKKNVLNRSKIAQGYLFPSQKGFTLVEVMMVVAILPIIFIALYAVASIEGQRTPSGGLAPDRMVGRAGTSESRAADILAVLQVHLAP